MSNLMLRKNDFNFFSAELEVEKISKRKIILFSIVILFFIIIIAGAYFIFENKISSIQMQIEDLDAYLTSDKVASSRKLANEKRNEFKNLEEFYISLQDFNTSLQKLNTIGTKYIEKITSAIPQGIFFESISLSGNQLQIQGTAPNRQLIAEYQNNLQSLDIYSEVYVSSIFTLESAYSFELSCLLKDVINDETN
ncbi:MAG: PilN domain-containing protein [Clostridiales bacterium]|nr:PilN domain-containing protein [Clostridiales bacterium]